MQFGSEIIAHLIGHPAFALYGLDYAHFCIGLCAIRCRNHCISNMTSSIRVHMHLIMCIVFMYAIMFTWACCVGAYLELGHCCSMAFWTLVLRHGCICALATWASVHSGIAFRGLACCILQLWHESLRFFLHLATGHVAWGIWQFLQLSRNARGCAGTWHWSIGALWQFGMGAFGHWSNV